MGYSRHRVPVSETDIPSSFVATLEFVVEEAEFGLGREASAAHERVRRETVVIGDDRPEVGDFHRDRSVESADLVRRERQARPQPMDTSSGRLLTMTSPLWVTHDLGTGTFPSDAFQYS